MCYKVFLQCLCCIFILNLQSVHSHLPCREHKEFNFDKSDLISVEAFFRHGGRTPLRPPPSTNPSDFPEGWGELTNDGRKQAYDLGKWLRRRYSGFLNEKYLWNEIYARSTDYNRTLMSAQLVLAGIYPPVGDQIWLTGLNWQPIPVHSKSRDEDYGYTTHCHKNGTNFKQTEDFKKLNASYAHVYEHLSQITGEKISDVYDFKLLGDTASKMRENNLTLPSWAQNATLWRLWENASANFYSSKEAPFEYSQINAGYILNQILDNFVSESVKLKLSSAHDWVLYNILNGLKVYDYNSINNTATIILELRLDRETQSKYVSIFYKNFEKGAELLSIPCCGKTCPLEIFAEIYRPILISDWKKACEKELHPNEV